MRGWGGGREQAPTQGRRGAVSREVRAWGAALGWAAEERLHWCARLRELSALLVETVPYRRIHYCMTRAYLYCDVRASLTGMVRVTPGYPRIACHAVLHGTLRLV